MNKYEVTIRRVSENGERYEVEANDRFDAFQLVELAVDNNTLDELNHTGGYGCGEKIKYTVKEVEEIDLSVMIDDHITPEELIEIVNRIFKDGVITDEERDNITKYLDGRIKLI